MQTWYMNNWTAKLLDSVNKPTLQGEGFSEKFEILLAKNITNKCSISFGKV